MNNLSKSIDTLLKSNYDIYKDNSSTVMNYDDYYDTFLFYVYLKSMLDENKRIINRNKLYNSFLRKHGDNSLSMLIMTLDDFNSIFIKEFQDVFSKFKERLHNEGGDFKDMI